jgi:hypothetical protein
MRPAVTVDLTRMDLPEEEMWVVLWLGWQAQKIKPTEVTFYFNGHRVGSVKVPPSPSPLRHVIKRSRVVFDASVPVITKPATPATPAKPTVQCEHCDKVLTEQGYRAFHGVKCWRAP